MARRKTGEVGGMRIGMGGLEWTWKENVTEDAHYGEMMAKARVRVKANVRVSRRVKR